MKQEMHVLGIDIAKRVFHAVGMDDRGNIVYRKRCNTAKVTLCLLPVAPTTSDADEHIGLASVGVIGSAKRTAVDARQSAAVPEPPLRVRCEATLQVRQPRSRVAAAVPRRLGVAACVASAPFGR